MGFFQAILILLLALPAVAAVVVAWPGAWPGTAGAANQPRRDVLGALLAMGARHRLLAARTAGDGTTFHPDFVPGSTAEKPHETSWSMIDFSLRNELKEKNAPQTWRSSIFVGLDGMNVWLVVLTQILMVSAVLISWNSVTERVHGIHGCCSPSLRHDGGVFLRSTSFCFTSSLN